LEALGRAITQKKEKASKLENKSKIISVDMISCRKASRCHPPKKMVRINKFGKAAGSKISCISNTNKQSEKEIKKTISFTIISKRVGINLAKEAKTQNYKTWLKKIKDPNKWKNILSS
jgi:predicted transposase YbfD/YdcC